MTVTLVLDRVDLIRLIKGTGGPGAYEHPFHYLGELNGFPNERWEWNDQYLNNVNEWTLCRDYAALKLFIEQDKIKH
jgi:hypothetical protein